MTFNLRRLPSLTTAHRHGANQRTLGFFGAWKALDDDPVLLCDCADDDCAHRQPATGAVSGGGHRRS